MGKGREPEVILKTNERRIILDLWASNGNSQRDQALGTIRRSPLRGTNSVSVKHGKWVLSHLPAKPWSAPPPVEHYFPTE
jgi:hypothetical protein